MGIFDWLTGGSDSDEQPSALSRRDFFARVAGKGSEPGEPPPQPRDPNVLYSFHVAGFPYHDGPVLVPMLRVGMEFDLVPERGHPTDPNAVRIQWKRDHLGYVPAEHAAEVRDRLADGSELICRAARISANAELPKVLEVEVVRVGGDGEGDEGMGSG